MRDPLSLSPGNVNNLNSCNLTKDSLLNVPVCLRDHHIETLNVGQREQTGEARRYDGPGNGYSTGAQLRLSDSWHSRKRKRAIESCCPVDSQNSPSSTLGVRLCSTLSAKPIMLTIESLFPLRKDCTLSLIPSWGAEGIPRRSKFTYNKRAKQKSPSCCSRKPHPENCCYNDSSYWGQL